MFWKISINGFAVLSSWFWRCPRGNLVFPLTSVFVVVFSMTQGDAKGYHRTFTYIHIVTYWLHRGRVTMWTAQDDALLGL